jgi:hypothetical protein
MITLKAVTNTKTDRTLICTIRSEYSDHDLPMRIRFNDSRVELSPNLDGLEWILNKDRSILMEEIRDLVFLWSDSKRV